jgi:hypothetical protein
MDDTKEIGAIGASYDVDSISIAPLTTSDLDSMLMTSASADTLSTTLGTLDSLSLGSITIGNGSTGYTIGSGTHSNVTWTTGTTTSAIGQVYTIGPNTQSWGDISVAGGLYTQGNSGKISIQGENADIDINGKSMLQWMQKVEERLNILTPNSELEKDWDDLRKLGERYRKLEKKCKEKAEMWKKLKSMPAPKVN